MRPLLLLAGLAMVTPALAQTAATPPPVPGWTEMLDSLRDLPQRILAKLPPEQQRDPLVQQEAAQLAIGAMTSSGISVLGADLEHPMFLPLSGILFGIGQPNADTIYKTASIDPRGSYRIRGRWGSVRMAIMAQHGASPGDPVASAPAAPGPAKGQIDLSKLKLDASGRFDLLVSPERPAGYKGEWWKLEPTTGKLMVRLVSADWKREVDPTLSIERLDVPVERSRPTEPQVRDRIARFGKMANFVGPLLAGDPVRVKGQAGVNRMIEHNVDRGMMAGQFYYTAFYDVADDEALVMEAQAPRSCRYWSVILTNHLYVTTDWMNNQSSLNDAQGELDKDGMLRVVISARDPRVPNWVDTAGYPQGLIQGRWTECDSKPIPTLRKVKLTELRQILPAGTPSVTPVQREAIVRERRAALMQRRQW